MLSGRWENPMRRRCWKCGERYWRCQALDMWIMSQGRLLFKIKINVCLDCLSPARASKAIIAAAGARSLHLGVRHSRLAERSKQHRTKTPKALPAGPSHLSG
jgi:hypothetical protein